MKIAVYCRMARDESDKIKLQEEMLKKFAKEKGFEVIRVISEIGSGLDLTRQGLKEIMEIAGSKEVDIILTKDYSRIGRNSISCLEFISKIKKHARFKTMDDFEDEPNKFENIMLQIIREQTKKYFKINARFQNVL